MRLQETDDDRAADHEDDREPEDRDQKTLQADAEGMNRVQLTVCAEAHGAEQDADEEGGGQRDPEIVRNQVGQHLQDQEQRTALVDHEIKQPDQPFQQEGDEGDGDRRSQRPQRLAENVPIECFHAGRPLKRAHRQGTEPSSPLGPLRATLGRIDAEAWAARQGRPVASRRDASKSRFLPGRLICGRQATGRAGRR